MGDTDYIPGTQPEPGENNLWYAPNDSDLTVVFVHGVLSDSNGCWLREQENKDPVYWPKLITTDERLPALSIYLGGYYTAIDSGAYEIRNCARELFSALQRPDVHGRAPVMGKKRIVFVCHSTGGIVVRYMLCKQAEQFEDKQVGLVLIASPSYGAKLADRLSWIADLYNHRVGAQLQWGNWSLRDLDDDFKNLVHNRQIPQLSGIEAYENHFIIHRSYWPDKKLVVSKESAGRYFGEPVLLRKTNHFTSVKPDGLRHPAHQLLGDFLHKHFSAGSNVADTGGSDADRTPGPAQQDSRNAQVNQTFDAPVGKVINVINELGMIPGVATRLPPHIQLATTLIDRGPQYEEVCDAIEERIRTGRTDRPLIFFLRGGMPDVHRAFVLRIEKFEFAQGGLLDPLGRDSPYVSLGRCTWPSGRDYLSVLRSLAERLGLNRRATGESIEQALVRHPASVGFSHHIGCATWGARNEGLLTSWLDYVANDWPACPDNRLCIAFVCVELATNPTGHTERLNNFIQTVGAKPEWQGTVKVIEELGEISVINVGDWAEECFLKYSHDLSQPRLANAESFFGDDETPRRLREIYGELFDVLERSYQTPGAQFGA